MQDHMQVPRLLSCLINALDLLTPRRNLPKFDYLSMSDPVCVVKYAKNSSNASASIESRATTIEIWRSEVVPNDSHPEFATSFRFDPQLAAYKENRESAGPAPSTLCFEFYDAKMRDAYRDSKTLRLKEKDLLGKVEIKLDEIFEQFVDIVAEKVFKDQLSTDSKVKGDRRYREEFMKSVRENNSDVGMLKKFIEGNTLAMSSLSWSIDRPLNPDSKLSSDQNSNTCFRNCLSSSSLDSPSITLSFCCIPKNEKNTEGGLSIDATKMIATYTSLPHRAAFGTEEYDFAGDDEDDEDLLLRFEGLKYSNLIPFRASDTPSIKQQVQRVKVNKQNQLANVEFVENVGKLIEKGLIEFLEYTSIYREKNMRTKDTVQSDYPQEGMRDLRTTAFKNPRLFYARGPVGEPYTIFGFLLKLHTFRDEFPKPKEPKEETSSEDPKEGHNQTAGKEDTVAKQAIEPFNIIDYWQILDVLKLGLLRSLLDQILPENDLKKKEQGVSVLAELTRRYKTKELEEVLKAKLLGKDLKKEEDQKKMEEDAKQKFAQIDALSQPEEPGKVGESEGSCFAMAWILQFSVIEDYIAAKKSHKPEVVQPSQTATPASADQEKAGKLEENCFPKFMEENVFPVLRKLVHSQHAVDIICAIECEFQWLMCQAYSPNVYPLEDFLMASQPIASGTLATPIHEYTGENVLHLLIIRGNMEAIRRLHKLITCSDYKLHMMNGKVTGRFFCPGHKP